MMAKIFLPFFLVLFLSMPLFSAPMEQSDDEMSEDAPAPAGKEELKKSKTPGGVIGNLSLASLTLLGSTRSHSTSS